MSPRTRYLRARCSIIIRSLPSGSQDLRSLGICCFRRHITRSTLDSSLASGVIKVSSLVSLGLQGVQLGDEDFSNALFVVGCPIT
jgi:hypothetical protein